MKEVQVFGTFEGHWSNSIVSRTIARYIQSQGCDVSLYPIMGNHVFDYCRGLRLQLNPNAKIGVFVGYPQLSPPFLDGYKYKVGFFITEASLVPRDWIIPLGSCNEVYVPSRWVQDVFYSSGAVTKNIALLHHGIDKTYSLIDPVERPGSKDKLRLLHICGAISFPRRKGLPELFEALSLLKDEIPIELIIKTEPTAAILDAIGLYGLQNVVTITGGPSLHPRQMMEMFAQVDALIQPSRAEAFGICPCEARACGLPVILTETSGHLEHIQKYDVVIPMQGMTQINIQGIINAVVPNVTAQDIATAIRYFNVNKDNFRTLSRENADAFRYNWLWKTKLRRLHKAIKSWK